MLGLAAAAAAGPAHAALPANCTESATIVTCTYTTVGESMLALPPTVSRV